MKSPSTKTVTKKPFELLLDQKQIAKRVAEMGTQITKDYAGEIPVIVGVLKGCIIFIADLVREIKLPIELEFVSAASYRRGIAREEDIEFSSKFSIPLEGRHVLVVEGVVDSGKTVALVVDKIRKMEPASLAVVTLLDKPGSHRAKVDIKYTGFTVGNEFVIGFGLDNTQKYRNLPFIGRLLDR
ncbi:MAG: hypoxanthine phosphoribosyltransferase [Candidatus Zixiibacteriota bacterium]